MAASTTTAAAGATAPPAVHNLPKFIEEAKPTLAPPVANKLLYGAGQHKVMIVGGPNVRDDYHLEEGEEIFLQLDGRMVLKIFEGGKPKDVEIKEGEVFFLPRRVPHSPQRFANTVGLVLERERLPTEHDALTWYTADKARVLYRETFYCSDLGVQLKPVIERFHASDEYKTGLPVVDYEGQASPITPDPTQATVAPFNLAEWIAANAGASGDNTAVLCGPGALHPGLRDYEYTATVVTGPSAALAASGPLPVGPGELFLYLLDGAATVTLTPASTATAATAETGGSASAAAAAAAGAHTVKLGKGDTLLVPGGGVWAARIEVEAGSSCMHVVNSKVVPAAAGTAATTAAAATA